MFVDCHGNSLILFYRTKTITEKMFCINNIWVRVMVFNASFNNISVMSWRSVLLVEETRGPGENHRPLTYFYLQNKNNYRKKMFCIMFVVLILCKGRRDRMVVGITTTCAVRDYHH
jgi:hypothetical protein